MKIKSGYPFVILSGFLSGFVIFGGQIFSNLGLSWFEIATLPYAFSLLFLIPLFFIQKQALPKLSAWPLLLVYGFVAAVLTFLQFGGLIFGVPVAVVILLLYTQPLWTIILSFLFLKEKVSLKQIIACVLVLFGVVVMINPFSQQLNVSLVGVLIALLGGLFLSFWVLLGGLASKRGTAPVTIKLFEIVLQLVFLALLYPFLVLVFGPKEWFNFSLNWPIFVFVGFILFSFFLQVVRDISLYKGMKKAPLVDVGIILLLEPLVGALLAVLFLGQFLTIEIIIGGALILIANYLVITSSQKAIS